MVCFGNVIDRKKYYQVESDRHHTNLFVALVGQSSKGRKGTSFNRIMSITKLVDHQWVDDRVQGGLSSGEGLINVVRDPIMKWDREAKAKVETDHGVHDKRLLVVEPEFAGVLAVMERAGNTISQLIRKAWDGGKFNHDTGGAAHRAQRSHLDHRATSRNTLLAEECATLCPNCGLSLATQHRRLIISWPEKVEQIVSAGQLFAQ